MMKRQLSTALGQNQNLKYALCFSSNNEILSQQQKNLIRNNHVTDDVITLDVTWEDIL